MRCVSFLGHGFFVFFFWGWGVDGGVLFLSFNCTTCEFTFWSTVLHLNEFVMAVSVVHS